MALYRPKHKMVEIALWEGDNLDELQALISGTDNVQLTQVGARLFWIDEARATEVALGEAVMRPDKGAPILLSAKALANSYEPI